MMTTPTRPKYVMSRIQRQDQSHALIEDMWKGFSEKDILNSFQVAFNNHRSQNKDETRVAWNEMGSILQEAGARLVGVSLDAVLLAVNRLPSDSPSNAFGGEIDFEQW